MGNRRDILPIRFPQLFHECGCCHAVGLKPGILATKYGDYGIRNSFKEEKELRLDHAGLCDACAQKLDPET